MKRRHIVIAVLLLLGLVAGLLLISTMGGGDDAPDDDRFAKEEKSVQQHAGPPRPEPPPTGPPPAADLAQIELVAAEVAIDPELAGGAFEGVVVNWGTGKPVPDAELTFMHAGSTVSVRSDPTGRFRFEPPAPGRYRLAVASADGFLPYAPELGRSPIELVARPRKRVSGILVYLSPAIEYTGVVLDASGEPVEGAAIVRADGKGESALIPLTNRFTSKADGSFTFHGFDGTVFEASHPTAGFGRGELGTAEQVSHRMEIRLTSGARRPEGTIAGVVVDERGQPIAGARVRAAVDDASQEPIPTREAETGDDGRFSLSGLEARAHAVSAAAEGYARRGTSAKPGQTNVRIELPASAVITGRVVDAGGAAVPSFTVVASRARGPLERGPSDSVSVFDGDGAFEITGLDAGAYAVVATGAGFAPSAEVVVTARRPDDAEPVTVALRPGGVLVGRVIDAGTRAPLEKARVSTESRTGSGATATPAIASAVTAADGSFRLPGLAPGKTSVNVAAFGHHTKIVTGIEVAGAGEVGPLTIELEPTKDGEKPKTEIAGIGCAIGAVGDGLRVSEVFPGSGCAEAGLEIDDVIVAVDGVAVIELGFDSALQRLRGPAGTTVQVSLRRAADPTRDVTITRRKITL